MNTDERKEAFKQYIETCMNKSEQEPIGIGNPYAKILLIGKESSLTGKPNVEVDNRNVKRCFENDDLENLFEQPRHHVANHTWNIYQKLIDQVRGYACTNKEKNDFCRDAFTTEINNTVCQNTRKAVRKLRIETFKNSEFIKGFPVIILACSNYIRNEEGNWQINDTFDVTFDEVDGAHTYPSSKTNWYFTHHSKDGKRLVIHTRQLSQNCMNQLVSDIAEEIKKHLEKIGETL